MNKLYYEFKQTNSKDNILFLHGWGLSGKSFDKIISKLNNVSYIKLDLFGFGKSDSPREYFDAYEYAYQIFLLLRKLNVDNLIIVGHSFGGRVAIILTSVFNIKVKNLVLTSSAGLNRFSLRTSLKVVLYKFLKYLKNHKIINAKTLESFGSRDYRNADNSMRKVLLNVVVQDLTFLLKCIKCKTLLVWDKKDKETMYWICKKFKKLIACSDVVLYEHGEHFAAFKNSDKFSKMLDNLCDCA